MNCVNYCRIFILYIDLAVEEINERSSIKFYIYYEDRRNQPKEAVSAYNKIASVEKLPVVITALSSVASGPESPETSSGSRQVRISSPVANCQFVAI
ncbi:MAG: hypothetical protein AB1414_05200 [bacterium]